MRVIFLDRDGVINKKAPDGEYITTWDKFVFLPHVSEALQILRIAGFKIIIVTNQRGIARGVLSHESLADIHRRMADQLGLQKAFIDAVYYCPHDEGACNCRKPEPGLLERAHDEFREIDFSKSYMIGDSYRDIEVGKRMGCYTVFITEHRDSATLDIGVVPDIITFSLFEAARLISMRYHLV